MSKAKPQPVRLADYRPPSHLIDAVELRFELDDPATRVHSRLAMRRNPAGDGSTTVVLHRGDFELERLALEGETLARGRYRLGEETLAIDGVPDRFTLEAVTRLEPEANTSLEGLYKSSGNFCTQCESEGFRKITCYLDRPDVLARFRTTLEADRERCPVLLSNGNPVASGDAPGGRHWVTWEDPFPKPSYLFALVAGRLECVERPFVTRSGREVRLRCFVEAHNAGKCDHALAALDKAMRWDEEVFGLEYDLDTYMIVAVDDFNMGAMENKGLNVFNSKYVLADPESATDDDYVAIESVIAHEYFHNWTGNRVTLRDWFQLSLKEGLTMFRDQEFSSDVFSRPLTRIDNVRLLRTHQFSEDAGPMAHPVRPDSYIEISNFYTTTVYNKGAEVIRMVDTLLGRRGFLAGMALYIERHDGRAVTADDFLKAMEDANGVDLGQFRRWYEQAGTPALEVTDHYDARARAYTLIVRQSCPPTPGQPRKAPFHIPLALGLLGPSGEELALTLEGESEAREARTRVLELRAAEERFRFVEVPERPVPSLLRDFSAPVRLEGARDRERLAFLFAHDPNAFNRWDAGQEYATSLLLALVADARAGRALALDAAFAEAMARTLGDPALERGLIAEALVLPSENYLIERMEEADVDALHAAREFARRALAERLREPLAEVFQACLSGEPYRFDPESCGRRRLANVCLGYLMALGEPDWRAACLRRFREADNMTEALGALGALARTDCPEREHALAEFERRWRHDPLTLDKWFAVQATSPLPGTLERVRELLDHPRFSLRNPNRVRALIGAFCFGNPVRFHDPSGAGYRFLADHVLELDPLNPQVAARLLGALTRWRKFDRKRQRLMKAELERVADAPTLSRDTYEVALKGSALEIGS